MGNLLNELIRKVKAERLAARRYVAMLLVLAMLTSISVSWRLHQVGMALTTDEEYYCGYEEHIHDDSCYTEELVCGYEEGEIIESDPAFGVDAEEPADEPEEPAEPEMPAEPEEPKVEVHHHTEDCYQEVTELTCDYGEHTHDELCYDTETGDLLCTVEEHTHDESCYTTHEELVCGYEEGEEIPVEEDADAVPDAENSGAESSAEDTVVFDEPESAVAAEPEVHHHTEACYEKVLTCTLPEHTHTLECLANWSADVEGRDDWDKYGEGLSDCWTSDLVQVAVEQLGYTESEKNFTVDEALGEAIDVHHYTRYGQWYGNPYAAWDVMFVSFCQHYAGIPKEVIPQRAGLFALRTDLEAAHPEYLTEGGAKAAEGQIVTYYNSDGEETIGIVEAVDEETGELTVISGAVNGKVAEVVIQRADITNTILVTQAWADYYGYTLDDDKPDTDEEPEEPSDSDDPADSEESEEPSDEEKPSDSEEPSDDEEQPSDSEDPDEELKDEDFAAEEQPKADSVVMHAPAKAPAKAPVLSAAGAAGSSVDLATLNPTVTTLIQDPANPKNWIKMPEGHKVTEGDNIRIEAEFTTNIDTFYKADGTHTNVLHYDLGVKLSKELSNLAIMKKPQNVQVGTFSVTEDGKVTLTFDEGNSALNLKSAFDAYFYLEMNATMQGSGEEETVRFPGMSESVTIYRKRDVKVEKSAPMGAGVGFDEKGYFIAYKVDITTENGTGTEIDLHDEMKQADLTGSYDKDSFVVTDQDGKTVTLDQTQLQIDTTKKTFDLKLPKLEKGNRYTLTYKYRVDDSFAWDRNNVYRMENTIQAKRSSEEQFESESTANPSVKKAYLTKSHTYGNAEQKKNLIAWTIELKNPAGTDLNGYTLTDAIDAAAKNAGVQIKGDVVIAGGGKITTLNGFDGHDGFTYVFPAGSTETYYKITYYTTLPNKNLEVKNTAEITKKGDSHSFDSVTDGIQIAPRSGNYFKSPYTYGPGNLTVIGDDGKLMKASNWKLTVVTQQGATSFTVQDSFQTPMVSTDGTTPNTADTSGQWDQYATLSELDEQLKRGMTIFTSAGNYSYTNQSDIVTFHYYSDRDCRTEVEDGNDEVRSFSIALDWSEKDFVVTQINVNDYSTYIKTTGEITGTEYIRAYNELRVDGIFKTQGLYEKTPKKSNLTKLVADNSSSFVSSSTPTTYQEGKELYFKLFLENPFEDEIKVTDTLPLGMEYAGEYYVGYSPEKGSGSNGNKKMTPFDASDTNLQATGQFTVTQSTATDGRQVLTFQLTGMNKWKLYGKHIGIVYKVKLSDPEWNNVAFNHKDYMNTATWGTCVPATATVSADRGEFHLAKSVIRNEDDESDVTYQIKINEGGIRLLPTGKRLELKDIFTVPSGVKASLKSFTLHRVDRNTNTETQETDYTLTGPDAQTDADGSTVYTMQITVPDQQEYRLEYTYSIDTSNAPANQDTFELSNKVEIFGKGAAPEKTQYKAVKGGAGTKQEDDLDILTLLKVEAEKENVKLDNVAFALYAYDQTSGQWEPKETDLKTQYGGKLTFATKDGKGDVRVDYDTLYKVVETATVADYLLDDTPHYFLLSSTTTTDFDAAYKAATGSDDPVDGMIDTSSVLYAKHNEYKTLKVTNAKADAGYELPATGSTGTTPYTAGGALMMGAALVCGYLKKRRRGKEAE